ncbi:MAG: hypothetical protein M1831_000823 [Alyxoria varia]|nr:MAG: hypothetical protein M1831_000823 [Alyxoria varia]
MFRSPRETAPCSVAQELGRIFHPVPVSLWGPLALDYLGVPIVVGVHNVVVQDEAYSDAIQKLVASGFERTDFDRKPPAEVLERLPDPERTVSKLNEGYKNLDRSSTTFKYPSRLSGPQEQVVLIPNSFAHLPVWPFKSTLNPETSQAAFAESHYNIYGNLAYPLEQALTESFVKAAVDEGTDTSDISHWGELLRSWISMMVGYLEVENNVLDGCDDTRAVEWFSVNFGRKREAIHGPFDRRVSKRLGSGKEPPVDMRGHPI